MIKASWITTVGLLLVIVLLVSARSVRAADWEQIGYGTLASGDRFDVYIDTSTIVRIGDKVRFWQGHVFHGEQLLPSGAGYMRVSIERQGECVEKTDMNLQAIFYGSDGSVLKNYKEDNPLKPVGQDTIRRGVLEFVCRFQK